MLLNRQDSCVILVDVQEKLLPLIHDYRSMLDNCSWVLKAASYLSIPIIVSEQYPKGLGATVAELKKYCPDAPMICKRSFSCTGEEAGLQTLNKLNKKQIVLIGIETHVCVLQTAYELLALGKEVFIVCEASSSRDLFDKKIAMKRFRQDGINIVSKEMVLFEWLKTSAAAEFKHLSETLLKS